MSVAYFHSTKIMNTLLIVALGKAENLMSVINVDMFGTIGMEQISLSLDNHIVVVVICYIHSAT